MASASSFEVFTTILEIVVVFFAVVAVLLVIALAIMRNRNTRARNRSDALRQHWQKLFRTVFTTPASSLPVLEKNEFYTVLLVFTNVRELRQSDRESTVDYGGMLNAMARKLGLDDYARRLLRRGDRADSIVALNALGQLGDQTAMSTAESLIDAPGTEISRAAGHCMLRLNPNTIDVVLLRVRDRKDWVQARVEAMLRELGPQRLDPAMGNAMATADDADRAALFEYVSCCSPSVARDISLHALEVSQSPEAIAAALRALGPYAKPEDAPVARRYATHNLAFVRLAALRALKNVADRSDVALLSGLLSDRDWWVRHRAAEVLVLLSGGNSETADITQGIEDPYARAAVTQAVAAFNLGILEDRISDRRETGGRGPEART